MSEIDISNIKAEYDELTKLVSGLNAYQQPEFPVWQRRLQRLNELLELLKNRDDLNAKVLETKKLVNDPELATLAQAELVETKASLEAVENELEAKLVEPDANDAKNIIIEIRAGAGGDEASLFAADLYRMYVRYTETHQLKTSLISQSASEVGGFKEIIFSIKGDSPYSKLKYESGVHRVQRIPSTESSGRIHTSTATVAVMPEAEETEVSINPADLRIDVFRSGGHGGQSVNTTDSAVRITHIPSGIVVTCQDEKSQLKNKNKAMGVLRSRLLAQQLQAEQSKLADARRVLIGSGDRSEKIRTYNLPQDRITDHRIGYTRSNLLGALDGNIDDLIEHLATADRELRKNT